MPRYLLSHRHEPGDCRRVFAAWNGFDSPLRSQSTMGSCLEGGHRLWWTVDASDEQAALAHLPAYVAERTEAMPVSEVAIP